MILSPMYIGLISAGAVVLLGSLVFFKRKKRKPLSLNSGGLQKPRSGFSAPLRKLLGKTSIEVENILCELEEILLAADVGVSITDDLIEKIKLNSSLKTGDQIYGFVKQEIKDKLNFESKVNFEKEKPYVIYLVGINGTGKTTTIGKLAHQFMAQGKKVLIVAADTYRAAAVEQLKVWADRSGADFVGGQMKSDPASVIFDGISAGQSRGVDIILVDTAGRLHNHQGLMTELEKMVSMSEKVIGSRPHEIWLTLDATTGQNGLIQANVFHENLDLTGLVLTKFDGTAKGGILVAIRDKTGLPIRYVGVGEKIEDLKEFNASEFVEQLF